MKIIHTSDWHIGRRFDGRPLEDDQRAFVAWLTELVAAESIDLVIVAGDVYDRSQPAAEAFTLLDDALDGLVDAGASVVLIPGNHDSAIRLGVGARRDARAGIHKFTDARKSPEPFIFEAGGESVAIVAVPYLDPVLVDHPVEAADGTERHRTHENVLIDALEAGRRALPGGIPSIAVAHAFVTGADVSDSEKSLSVGGSDQVASAIFDGYDYVALGHLHRPQTVGADHIVYSGSPLPYSFSEDHEKSIRIIEVAESRIVGTEQRAIPVGRPVHSIKGTLDQLLVDPDLEQYVDHWIAMVLTDETAVVEPMERISKRFPHTTSLRYERSTYRAHGSVAGDAESVEQRRPEDVTVDFLVQMRDRPLTDSEQEIVLAAVKAAVREVAS
jgi:exonuclease SbcD